MDIVEFWKQMNVDTSPYIHPKDVEYFKGKFSDYASRCVSSYEEYVDKDFFYDKDNHIDFSLLPMPYCGDIQKSKIIVLMLNPGVSPGDYCCELNNKEYRHRLVKTLRQEFDGVNYKFLCFDPSFSATPGFIWWVRKFDTILRCVALKYFGNSYRAALQFLSNIVSCVDLVAYRSVSSSSSLDGNKITSSNEIRRCVTSMIKNNNKSNDKKLFIATRAARQWGVEAANNCVVYSSGQAMKASLSTKTTGGQQILLHIAEMYNDSQYRHLFDRSIYRDDVPRDYEIINNGN